MLTMSVMCVIWKEGETERKKEIRRKEREGRVREEGRKEKKKDNAGRERGEGQKENCVPIKLYLQHQAVGRVGPWTMV